MSSVMPNRSDVYDDHHDGANNLGTRSPAYTEAIEA
jgi:hypothetical protein